MKQDGQDGQEGRKRGDDGGEHGRVHGAFEFWTLCALVVLFCRALFDMDGAAKAGQAWQGRLGVPGGMHWSGLASGFEFWEYYAEGCMEAVQMHVK